MRVSDELQAGQNNMFKLNQAIADWRRQMTDAGIKTPVPLDELENHLREDIETQMQAGAAPEQAFRRAVERIGTADNLKNEFEKVQEMKTKRECLRRFSALAGTGFVYSMLAVTWCLGVRRGKMEMTGAEIALALGAVAPMLGFGWAGRAIAKFLPLIHQNWVIAFAFAALAAGAMTLRMFFDELSATTPVHVQIFALWMLSPLPGLGNCVSAWHGRCEADRAGCGMVEA